MNHKPFRALLLPMRPNCQYLQIIQLRLDQGHVEATIPWEDQDNHCKHANEHYEKVNIVRKM